MNQIKTKLFLMLLPLLISMLFLGLYTFVEKYKQYKILNETSKTTIVSMQISNLVHAIQLERGISSRYIEEQNPKYISIMKIKRENTDTKYKSLLETILNGSSDLENEDKVIKKLYTQINIIRTNINKKKSVINIFKAYSGVIRNYLQLINKFSYSMPNKDIAREYSAFLTLLWLQENAAKERGILSVAFEANKVDVKKYILFSEYTSKFDQLLYDFHATAPLKYREKLDDTLQKQIIQKINILIESVKFKVFRNYFLNDLLPLLGFKGMIHHFKTYLIRGDEKLIELFKKDYEEALRVIDSYYLLDQFSKKDKEKILIIKATLKLYIDAIDIVKVMKKEKKNIIAIDNFIKINGWPAVNAIQYLRENVGKISVDEWWELSSKRIDLIKHISDDMQKDILFKSNNEIENTAKALIAFLLIFVVIICMSLILGILIMRRVVGDLIATTDKIDQMRNSGDYSYIFNIKGSDELSDMQKAFNQLIIDRNEAELNQKLSAEVFKNLNEGVIILNKNMEIEAVNPSFNKITGYDFDEVEGKYYSILHVNGNTQLFYLNIEKTLLKNGIWEGEFESRRKNNEVYFEFLTITTIEDKDNNISKYIMVFRDITEKKEQEEKIFYQANYDALTGLANRNKGMELLSYELKIAKRNKNTLALMFIDLDKFKIINDTFGHESGDIVLKEISQRFFKCVREIDSVIRLGGDEFLIILPNISNINDIHQIAQKIINETLVPCEVKGKVYSSLSVSIGISFYPQDAQDIDSMIKHADEMMYKAKNSSEKNYMLYLDDVNSTYMI